MNQPAAHPVSLYTPAEENANTITGAIGVLLAVVGSMFLLVAAVKSGATSHIVSACVFAASLILLYTATTLYHGARDPRTKHRLMVLDHSAIFLLIAGTYTPVALISLRGVWGWSILSAVWGVAAVGIIFERWIRNRQVLRLGLYLLMGWALVVAMKPMLAAVAPMGLVLIFAGGLTYTLGVGFYSWQKLPYHHAIWHLFVLAGSTFHFFAILCYIIPAKG